MSLISCLYKNYINFLTYSFTWELYLTIPKGNGYEDLSKQNT